MACQEIDAQLLAKMFIAGAKTLDSEKERINELNVFPVPDGDTGTNMTMTIMSAAKEVAALEPDADMATVCKAISSGSLRGARGNSGVILSQLLRGFTRRAKTEEVLTGAVICEAFAKAVETAYKAVMKPTEGTILTVSRGISEKVTDLTEDGCSDVETLLKEALAHGQVVLDRTPELLPVLKQAGVVDSGGAGLICALSGAIDYYLGKEMDLTISDEPAAKAEEEEAQAEPEKTTNIYQTKLKVHLHAPFTHKNEKDVREYLNSIGELVELSASDKQNVVIELCTDDPGLVIQKALKYGVLSDVEIKNSNLEGTAGGNAGAPAAAAPEAAKAEEKAEQKPAEKPAPAAPEKPYGFIAVSAGEGLSEIFRSLGVDYIIEGGQTMNPSTADILDAVDRVPAETIFVLPNNKNIIMAANQARELTTEKNLLVIPTKTIPQGITAAINFSAGVSPDENEETMMEEIRKVKTGEITYAVRDTEIDDKKIAKGDYMGIGDKGILSVGTDMEQVLLEMVGEMVDDESELISIYYGADIEEAAAEQVRDRITEKFSGLDVELQSGGQPIYYYIVSVE